MNDATKPQVDDRVRIVRSSMRCFVYGLIGLLPVIGLPWALLSIVAGWRVNDRRAPGWNPAGGYLSAGRWLGPSGFAVTACFLLFVAVILPALAHNVTICPPGGRA